MPSPENASTSSFQPRAAVTGTGTEQRQPGSSTGADPSSSEPRTRQARGSRNEGDKRKAVAELFRNSQAATREDDNDASFTHSGETNSPTSKSLFDTLGTGDEDAGGGASEQQAGGALDLSDIKAVAKALGTTPKALYDGLKFTVGDDQLTLGQLKDRVRDQTTAVQETAKREAALIQRESAIVRDNQLLAQVMGDLQGKLRPETVKQLVARQKATEAREFQMMRQTMPELADPKVFVDWRTDVVGMLSEYGFQPHEVHISDHRMLLALRDMLRFKKLLAKVANLETERTRKDPPATVRSRKQARPNGKAAHTEAMQRARTGSEADKVTAVSRLISG